MTAEHEWRAKDALTAVIILAVVVLLYLFVGPMLRPETASEEGEVATDVAVHVAEISRATMHRWVTAYGRIEPEPPGPDRPPASVQVGSSVGGLLVGIDCVEGRRVEAGETLFRMDSRVAEVTLQSARQALDFAEKTYARQQELIAANGTSERAFQEAEAARAAARVAVAAAETQLALLRITAPIAGTVVRIDAQLGQAIEANTILAEIVDLDRLVVSANIPSTEATGLTVGMPAELDIGGRTSAHIGTTGSGSTGSGSTGSGTTGRLVSSSGTTGRLVFVADNVDPQTDTVLVRVSVPADLGRFGQFLDLRVLAEEHADRLVVPEAALVTSAEEGEWIVLVDGNRARRAPVTSGLREGGLVEVEGEGLHEGMTIVTEDAYSLPPETAIHIVGR
jgi:membrane fusion protein (multidrug efflux system)